MQDKKLEMVNPVIPVNTSVRPLWFGVLAYICVAHYISESMINFSTFELAINVLNTNLLTYSRIQAIGYLASCVSTLVFLYTLDKWNRQVQLAAFGLLAAVTTSFIPINISLGIFLVLSVIKGICSAGLIIVPNVFIVEIFQKRPMFYLQLLNVLYIIVNGVMPYAINPFQSPMNTTSHTEAFKPISGIASYSLFNISSYENFKEDLELGISESNYTGGRFYDGIYRSRIWMPHQVAAFLQFLSAFILLVAYFIKPYEKPATEDEGKDRMEDIYERGKRNLKSWQLILFVVLTSLVLACFRSNVNGVLNSLSIILMKNVGTQFNTSFYLFSIGTLVGSLVNLALSGLSTQVLLSINFVPFILGNVLIMTWVKLNHYNSFLFIGAALLGAGQHFASIVSLVQERVGLSNKIMCILFLVENLSSGLSLIAFDLLAYFNDDHFIIISLATMGAALAFFLILLLVEKFRLSRKN